MTRVSIELPESISAEEARLELAIRLYQVAKLSQAQAAQLAGLTRELFIDAAAARGVSFTNITPDELAEELGIWTPSK